MDFSSSSPPAPITYDSKNRFGNLPLLNLPTESLSQGQGYFYGFYMKDGSSMPKIIEVDSEHNSATRKASRKNLRNQMKEENVIDSKCSVCRE